MAIQDNTVLPAPTAAAGAGMPPQIAAFLQMLMGGGGAQGGVPFAGFGEGSFGHFLMNNPGLLQGLFGPPQGAVPGPLPGAAPVQDSTPVGPSAPAAPGAPSTPSQISQDPAAATPATPAAPTSPPSQGLGGFASLLSAGGGSRGFESLASLVPPLLRKG